GVTVLLAFDIVGWRDVEGYVNWGVLLMYGGAIALGAALNRSGAAAWLAKILLSQWGHSPAAVIALLSAISIVLTEVMSNSAVVALLLPVALGISQQFGIDPRAMAPAIALPAGLAFTLPVGTPGNAIAYSSGYLRLRDMLVPGALLVVIAWATFNLVAVYYWPLIGLHVTAATPSLRSLSRAPLCPSLAPMPYLIPPHGGLQKPVSCIVPHDDVERFHADAPPLRAVPVSEAVLS